MSLHSRYCAVSLLIALSVSYVAVAASIVSLTTVQYDEFTDLLIAADLARNPLRGSTKDPSQARLPMYVTAVAYRGMQAMESTVPLLDALPVSRAISMLMTVAAIWGTAILGYRLFGAATGLLAAALFAWSPYVLHFGRDAMTQGDAFTPAAVVLVLLAFERFERTRTTFWLVCLACSLGLAIACKFTLAFLAPALMAFQLLGSARRYRPRDNVMCVTGSRRTSGPYIVLSMATGLSALLAVALSIVSGDERSTRFSPHLAAVSMWLLALLGVASSLTLGVARLKTEQTVESRDGPWRATPSWLAIVPLAAATALAICPEHIFNRQILAALIDRFETRNGGQPLFATAVVSAKLYAGILLFKLGLPLGVGTYVAIGWAAAGALASRTLLLLMVVLLCYGFVLAVLPLQQPFWLMSVYPIVLLLLAAMIVAAVARPSTFTVRAAVAVGTAFAMGWLILGLIRVYPTFGYYAYETVGRSWLGGNTVGYRALVVVTNDGSTEALEWLRRRAPAGSTVLSFMNDVHLIRYLQQTRSLGFELFHAGTYADVNVLADSLARADFVVERAVGDIDGPASGATAGHFADRFDRNPIHEIVRGRGVYRMPVIRIYRARDPSFEP